MKYIKGISLISAGAVLTLIAVSAVYIYRGVHSAPFVTVEVINNSDSEITQIKIEHEDGDVYHDHLGRGKRVYLPVYANGESSYSITVQLQNGKIYSGGVGYVEPGYSTKEVVTNTGIESEYGALY